MARWFKRLAIAVVLIVVLGGLLAETAGRVVVERMAQDQIRASGVAGGVEVTVGKTWWKPSVVPAVLFGNLDRVTVTLTDARLYSLPVDEADYVLNDLGVDLSIRDRTVAATSLGSGSVMVRVDPATIAELVGARATIRDDRLWIGDDSKPAEIGMEGSSLVIQSPTVKALTTESSIGIPVMDPQILPCTPEVHLRSRYLELSCTGQELPGILRTTIGADGSPRVGTAPPGNVELPPPATLELPEDPPTTGPPPSTTGG